MGDRDTALEQGIAHHRAGRFAEAAEIFRRLVATDPEDARAWRALGLAEWRLGALTAALADLDRAIALAPDLS